jgi:hypothetical protein
MTFLRRLDEARPVIALTVIAAFAVLGALMPDLTPHRLIHAPVGNPELESAIEKAVEGKIIGRIEGETSSINLLTDYSIIGGLFYERSAHDAEGCARRCLGDERCVSFAATKPPPAGPASPLCHLYSGAAQVAPSPCCIAGVLRPRTR